MERERLESLGHKVYDHIGDALGMSEDEKELMDVRISLSSAVQKRREDLGMSKRQLAIHLASAKQDCP